MWILSTHACHDAKFIHLKELHEYLKDFGYDVKWVVLRDKINDEHSSNVDLINIG